MHYEYMANAHSLTFGVSKLPLTRAFTMGREATISRVKAIISVPLRIKEGYQCYGHPIPLEWAAVLWGRMSFPTHS